MNDYLQECFTKHIKKDEIDIILEAGAMDCEDTVSLYEYYKPKKIYTFECNPDNVEMCKNNIINNNDIILTQKALFNKNEKVKFFITDLDKSIDKNRGASSLLYHLDNKVSYIQKETEVDGIRLDTFMLNKKIKKIDLLCLDLQGAENIALDGLGERIKDVKYILTEVSYTAFYENNIMFDELKSFLDKNGFELLVNKSYGPFGDALFKNKNK